MVDADDTTLGCKSASGGDGYARAEAELEYTVGGLDVEEFDGPGVSLPIRAAIREDESSQVPENAVRALKLAEKTLAKGFGARGGCGCHHAIPPVFWFRRGRATSDSSRSIINVSRFMIHLP